MKQVAVKNKSKIQQYTIVEGERFSIPPYETSVVDESIAQAFLRDCHPHVALIGGDTEVDPAAAGGKVAYIYNATGHPDAPATVKVQQWKKGQGNREMEIPNPQAAPRVLSLQEPVDYRPAVEPGTGDPTSKPVPGKLLEFAPYARKGLNEATAKWVLQMDSHAQPEMRRGLRQSIIREFEPSEFWPIDRLRIYAKAIDPRIPIDEVPAEDESMEDVRIRLYRRCWFHVVDPTKRVPNRAAFQAFEEKEVAKLAAKFGASGQSTATPVASTAGSVPTPVSHFAASLQKRSDTIAGALRAEVERPKRGPGRPSNAELVEREAARVAAESEHGVFPSPPTVA